MKRGTCLLAWTIPVLLALTVIHSFAQSIVTPYVFTTLAGNAGPGSTDGPVSAARLNQPHGLAVDGAGNVYVADTANSTIRKVTLEGVVTTLAGLAGSPGSTDGKRVAV